MARNAQARGLQPKRSHSRRAALLVLDVMSDFAFEDGPAVRRALVARCEGLARLLKRARRNGVPVIYVNDNVGLVAERRAGTRPASSCAACRAMPGAWRPSSRRRTT